MLKYHAGSKTRGLQFLGTAKISGNIKDERCRNTAFYYDGLVTKLCLTLADLMDCSLPGFSVQKNFQARILGWVAISFSRGFSHPGIEPGSLAL